MSIMELEAKRMGIFRMLLSVKNEDLLQKIVTLLVKEQQSAMDISMEVMRNAILSSQPAQSKYPGFPLIIPEIAKFSLNSSQPFQFPQP